MNLDELYNLDEALDLLNESSSDKQKRLQIINKSAGVLNTVLSENGIADCYFYNANWVAVGMINAAQKNKEFMKGQGKTFVLVACPKQTGVYASSYTGSNVTGGGYGATYSYNGMNKVGPIIKQNIAEINRRITEKIGPCSCKLGDNYRSTGNPTFIVTLR